MRRCGRCNQEKPDEEFAWRRRERGQRDNWCRPCRAEYKRDHYQRNKDRYVRNAAKRRDRMADERMAWLLDYLSRHPCQDCGERDPIVLEFDHVEDKRFSISRGLTDRPWQDLLDEIAKCEVVCANCHKRRTARRGDHRRMRLSAKGRSGESLP